MPTEGRLCPVEPSYVNPADTPPGTCNTSSGRNRDSALQTKHRCSLFFRTSLSMMHHNRKRSCCHLALLPSQESVYLNCMSPRYVTPAIGNTQEGWRDIQRTWTIDREFNTRRRTISAVIGALTPMRAWDSLKLDKKIQSTSIHPKPIFIIGHWRTGTTFLHNLLTMDPQFGFLTNSQALFPHASAANPLLRYWLRKQLPRTRPMDNMALGLNTPQEDEMALFNMGPSAFYHAWAFPRHLRDIYRDTITLDNAHQRTQWKACYRSLLKKTTLLNDGKQLVLKNPPHTGRVEVLLEMFPQARFIYLKRNPHAVFGSMKNMYARVWPIFQLQRFDKDTQIEAIFWVYEQLIQSYMSARGAIPAGQLIELTHEQLSNRPDTVISAIYRELGLGGYLSMRDTYASVLGSRARHQATRHAVTSTESSQIAQRWATLVEHSELNNSS